MIIVGWELTAPKGLHLAGVRSAIEPAASWLGWAALVCVIVMTVVAYVRHRNATRALKNRDCFELLPTSDFDPSDEQLLRTAFSLSRARPTSAWFTPRSALGVRVHLSTDESGLLTYCLSGPARVGSVLEQAGYPDVEVRRREKGEDV